MIATALKYIPDSLVQEKKNEFRKHTSDIYTLNSFLKEQNDTSVLLALLKYELYTKSRYSFIMRIYARFRTLLHIEDRKELEHLYNTFKAKGAKK